MTQRTVQIIVAVVALIVGIGVYRYLHPATAFAADGLDTRWDSAVDRSRETHTPSLVIFTADWCPACSALHAQVLSRPEIENEIAAHYTTITIDLTQPTPSAQARASRFGVKAIPTLIRFNAEGKETGRTHSLPPDRMLAWLREGE